MIESSNTTENLKTQLEIMFSNKEIKSFLIKINQSFQNHTIPLSDLYNLIGNLFHKNPDFFMDKLYRNIHMYAKIFNQSSQIYELERKILKRYCLFEGENIIKGFRGFIYVKNAYVDGYIYLTNKRIIIQGILKILSRTKTKLSSYSRGSNIFGIKPNWAYTPIGANPMGNAKFIEYSRIKDSDKMNSYATISKNYFLPFTHKTNLNYLPLTPCFGYQIPFIRSYNLIKKKKSIKYTINYEIKHENLIKVLHVSFRIAPLPPESKKNEGFKQEAEDILTLLEHTIKKHAIR